MPREQDSPAPDSPLDSLTRREVLARGMFAVGAAVALPLTGDLVARRTASNSFASVPPAGPLRLHSRPDLRIPSLAVDVNRGGTAPGQIFVSPFGLPVRPGRRRDRRQSGQPVWEYPVANQEIYNFNVQTYRGNRLSPGGRAISAAATASAST